MLLHHADQDGRGQFQILGLKGSQQGLRRLDQISHLVEQSGLVGDVAAYAGRRLRHKFRHQLASLCTVDHNAFSSRGIEVSLGVFDVERGEAACRQARRGIGKARAAADVAADNARPRKGRDLCACLLYTSRCV